MAIGHVRPARARAPIIPGKVLDKVVLDALAIADTPLGAYDIAESLRHGGWHVAMASLYRSLDRLCAEERIEKVVTIAAFRIKDVRHALLMICVKCGVTTPLAVPSCYQTLENAVGGTGFSIAKLALEAAGLCKTCSERTA